MKKRDLIIYLEYMGDYEHRRSRDILDKLDKLGIDVEESAKLLGEGAIASGRCEAFTEIAQFIRKYKYSKLKNLVGRLDMMFRQLKNTSEINPNT